MRDLFRNILVSSPNGGGLFLLCGDVAVRVDSVNTTGIDVYGELFVRGEQPDTVWIVGGSGIQLDGKIVGDIHDVLCVDTSVYVVSTEGNHVVQVDFSGNEIRRWSWDGEPDARHVNCLAYWRGEVVVSCFGEYTKHRGYKGGSRGAGLVQSLQSGKALITGLSQPHSLCVVGENLVLANSEEGEIREYDLSGELLRISNLGGYTRGALLHDGVLYVGLSRARGEAGSSLDAACVVALDSQTWGELGRLNIPADEIYAIKALPTVDEGARIIASIGNHLSSRLAATLAVLKEEVRSSSERIDATELALTGVREDLARAQHDLRVASTKNEELARRADDYRGLSELMKRSLSWRVTKPLRFLARLLRHGLTPDDRRRIGSIVRRYYHRLPLPAGVRRHVSVLYRRLLRRAVLAGAGVGRARWSPPAAGVLLAPQEAALPDYLMWGVIDWHFRHQRPQHLAQALAASGRRVFYISATLVDSEEPGFELEPVSHDGRLFSVRLYVKDSPSIYSSLPSADQQAQLRQGVGRLLVWARTTHSVSLVQHPFWLDVASVLPAARLVYDCMDHHEGFGNVPPEMMAMERALLAAAELTVTTSAWLDELVADKTARRAVIRNAGEYDHFATTPGDVFEDRGKRKVIGYYGAIAEWFDIALVEKVARRFPDSCVLLIGADTANGRGVLGKYPNVVFTGEIPYAELPRYLHAFSVCMLPFRIIPLTLATNPVKVYEYLSAGKPVVAVDLPEMAQFGGLVDVARDHDEYIAAIARRLEQGDDTAGIAARQAFAREQTWSHRAAELVAHAESAESDPLVSVIVVTYNNIELTRACLSSLDAHSHYENMEIIVVDNASADGSPEFLSGWASRGGNRKLVLNTENKGFAGGNNDGLAIASGEYLVLLNNDTYVTPGWIRTMVNHVRRDKTIGLLGPVTNNIGNEARIDIAYDSMAEMLDRSAGYTRSRLGRTFPLRTAAFFCVMIPRSTYQQVGPLDEAFGRGFFEDDDYCRRVEQLGLRIACAEDVFIHHHLSASFNKLKQQDRQRLFEENRKIYEAKWGEWIPHGYRDAGPAVPVTAPDSAPALKEGEKCLAGRCGVCGRQTRYRYVDESVWRESLTCEHCLTTSRYRSVGRGILRAISEACGIHAESLAELPKQCDRRLRVYDTQPPFYYLTCAYPLPDLLRATGWIDVCLSQYKPSRPAGELIAADVTNQNLECLTFPDEYFDIVITSDVMEHVRLDASAHREIHRVLKPGGVYVFTVPHDRRREDTLVRVQVTVPGDPGADVHLLEPEYHGDTNSDDGGGVLSYRVYGRDLEATLTGLGFEVQYSRDDLPAEGIMATELYFCRKVASPASRLQG